MELFHIDHRYNDFAQVVRFVSRQGKRLSDMHFVLLLLVLSVSRPQIEWFNVAERVKDGTKKMLTVLTGIGNLTHGAETAAPSAHYKSWLFVRIGIDRDDNYKILKFHVLQNEKT